MKIKVNPIAGEPTRFHVQGKSVSWYLVELCAFECNGQCGCDHFQFRLQPLLSRKNSGVQRCKHIAAAREVALDLMLKDYSERVFKRRSAPLPGTGKMK